MYYNNNFYFKLAVLGSATQKTEIRKFLSRKLPQLLTLPLHVPLSVRPYSSDHTPGSPLPGNPSPPRFPYIFPENNSLKSYRINYNRPGNISKHNTIPKIKNIVIRMKNIFATINFKFSHPCI